MYERVYYLQGLSGRLSIPSPWILIQTVTYMYIYERERERGFGAVFLRKREIFCLEWCFFGGPVRHLRGLGIVGSGVYDRT